MIRVLVVGPKTRSVVLDAEDLGAALVQIEVNRGDWMADHANALDVFPGAPETDVEAAMAREGWGYHPIARSLDGTWTVHERLRFDDEEAR